MNVRLDGLRSCFEGAIPAVIATLAADGMPNVAYLSQVHFLDNEHVALSFQFFNKTRENILADPSAMVQVINPDDGRQYRLTLEYLRTETEGPLFERMKARLAGIASHTGMSKIFRLLGADVYRVLGVQGADDPAERKQVPSNTMLAALRDCTEQLGHCHDLEHWIDTLLQCLQSAFGIEYAMVMMYDAVDERVYTVASLGYASSGVGSEIPIGAGIIGVAARERTPIRISYMTSDYNYSRAVRASVESGGSGQAPELESEIPFPGLDPPHSQLAVPVVQGGELLGVLYVESTEESRFDYQHEDALTTLAAHLALAIRVGQQAIAAPPTLAEPAIAPKRVQGAPVTIQRYAADNSVFIEQDYLIKGVAGAICWRLLLEFTRRQRTDFSNRELRLDPSIGLPEVGDNLEARLLLLQKRLAERCDFLGIEKTGRGRFRLRVERPVALREH